MKYDLKIFSLASCPPGPHSQATPSPRNSEENLLATLVCGLERERVVIW